MSEKVTFRELIDAIAEETDNSKQFTHDFLKDFVDVINNGLEQDGSVNIAGFGKFGLKKIDEREGFNPQTEEKITIPAHNKIVFKPYKDLRELVNAPYAHLEPELIEAENDSNEEDKNESQPTEAAGEDDFIPTAPPTSHDSLEHQKDDSNTGEEENTDPFGAAESTHKTSSSFQLEGDVSEKEEHSEAEKDIVEYNNDFADKNDSADEVDKIFGSLEETLNDNTKEQPEPAGTSTEDSKEETDEKTARKTDETEKKSEQVSPYAPESTGEEATDDELKEDEDKNLNDQFDTDPALETLKARASSSNKNSALPLIAAAIILLLLIAGGAWYLGFFSGNEATHNVSNRTIAKADISGQNQHSRPPKNSSKKAASSPGKPTKKKQSKGVRKVAQASPKNDDEEITISKGQTLWSIARKKYDNPRLWPWIYDHNESLDNPNLIIAGNSLSVPIPSGPQYGLTPSDSVDVAKGYIATYRWYKDRGSERAKNYLWVAKRYHPNIRDLTNMKIDKDDLAFANQAR